MRPLVVVLLSFIVATSCAMSIADDDEPHEPYERDEPYEMDELEKRADCQDSWSWNSCSKYKRYCSQSSKLRKYCAKTCNACEAKCTDQDKRCSYLKSYCNTNIWVQNNCEKTCDQCKKTPTRPITTPRPTTKPAVPRCDPNKIEGNGCVQWKASGYCQRSSRYFIFMKRTCPGNCGFCRGYKPPTPTKGPHTVKVNEGKCLYAHNVYRRRHGASPLTWDPKMAQEAQEYALKLAKIKTMKHDRTIRGVYGENLAWSYRSSPSHLYTCKDATKAWYDEIKDYDYANPRFSMKTGHFTQVVWKASRRLGVGIAKNGGNTYVVARYSPPGNYQGQFGANVGRQVNG